MDKLESEEHDFGTDPTVTRDIVTTLLPVGKLVGVGAWICSACSGEV